MPLFTVPRDMIAKILMALAPDYEALCCTAQTCVVLRDMETTDKEVLWKHMCETLITGREQDVVDHDPSVMLYRDTGGAPGQQDDSAPQPHAHSPWCAQSLNQVGCRLQATSACTMSTDSLMVQTDQTINTSRSSTTVEHGECVTQ